MDFEQKERQNRKAMTAQKSKGTTNTYTDQNSEIYSWTSFPFPEPENHQKTRVSSTAQQSNKPPIKILRIQNQTHQTEIQSEIGTDIKSSHQNQNGLNQQSQNRTEIRNQN